MIRTLFTLSLQLSDLRDPNVYAHRRIEEVSSDSVKVYLQAKKLREARRRKEEGLSMAFHTVLDAEKHSSEQPEEVLYANLATPLKTQERSHGRNQEYASVSQQPRTQQAAALSDAVHQSSIYLLRNCDVINSTEGTTPTHCT